jgi:hypothetical protein
VLGLTRLQLRQTSPSLGAIRQIHLRLWNGLLQNTFESDIQVKRLKRVNALLQSLGNGKVWRLYSDPVIGLRRVLSDEEQIRYFLVDELVITLNVFLIDIFHLLTARMACSSRPIPNGCRITVLTTPPVESKLPQFRYSLDMMGRSLFRIIRGLGYARRRAE